ncbi:KamA family radical SAM protein, partial [Candidatus Bipolaricaulota bacterium]|nr:KamA family radical SAM protein [Candidatus Bipolaricaulota bacterium]
RIDKYPCGLDEPLVKARETNRGRIREYFGASLQDWSDWQWQARNVLKGLDGFDALRELVPLRIEEATAVHEAVRSGIPWGITPYYLSLFDFYSS